MWRSSLVAVGVVVAFGMSSAWASRPHPAACSDDYGTCREDCTMDFGTSARTQSQLMRCLESCTTTLQTCSERWHELREANVEPETTVPGSNAGAPTLPEGDGLGPVEDVAPAEGRTRVEETPPEPPPSRVQTEDYNEGISLPSDEQLEGGAAPAPQAQAREPERPAERERAQAKVRDEQKVDAAPSSTPKKSQQKARPELPPEPKDDISEWDPDAE